MKSISIRDFRRGASRVLKRVAKGQSFVLTYRGKPRARLVPIDVPVPTADDSFYRLAEIASDTGEPLGNAGIDGAVYNY